MKKLFVILFSLGFAFSINAQQTKDPVIFEINGKKIYKSEFMKEFLRSVGKDPSAAPTACTYEKRKALNDYVDLFVNFRAKLEDAYQKGYDTMPSLVQELTGYRNELAAPYLIDSVTMQNLLREAYERNHYVLHAAHILVRCKPGDSPADTLAAYNKALEYRDRVTKGGEDFFTVSTEANIARLDQEHVDPDDPRRKDNGDLGNFTVFDMIYPFESASFALEPGQVSMPVRTNYGYHVIKLLSKTPYFGKSTFQHIWISDKVDKEGAVKKINEAYSKIQKGSTFSMVCREYSDDKSTSEKGGLLSDMALRQIPPDYVIAIAGMKPGEMSKPFHTSFGWHILLLNQKDSLGNFEDMIPYYKQRMTRDKRSNEPRLKYIEQCKKRYGFIDYTTTPVPVKKGKKVKGAPVMMASMAECRAALSDSIFRKKWHYNEDMVTDNSPLFEVAGIKYTPRDFLMFLDEKQRYEPIEDIDFYMMNRYNNYINDKVFEYADSHLEEENPEFAALINEYRNGLMIFSYNDDNVWRKAILDTVGLEAFYQTQSKLHNIDNEEEAPYFWNERAQITMFTVADSAMLPPNKAMSILNKATKKGWPVGQLSDKLNDALKKDGKITVEEKMVEKEHQNILKNNQWRTGIYVMPNFRGYQMVRVDKLIDPCLKSRVEARGYYINDYQNYLDEELVKSLRKKYNVVIHQDVIDEITY